MNSEWAKGPPKWLKTEWWVEGSRVPPPCSMSSVHERWGQAAALLEEGPAMHDPLAVLLSTASPRRRLQGHLLQLPLLEQRLPLGWHSAVAAWQAAAH